MTMTNQEREAAIQCQANSKHYTEEARRMFCRLQVLNVYVDETSLKYYLRKWRFYTKESAWHANEARKLMGI